MPYAALVLRVSLDALLLAHGSLKLLVFKPAGIAAHFRSLGLPGFLGYLTMAAEFGGVSLLVLGIAASLGALALIPLILGTIVMVHGSKGWLWSNEGGGWEFPAFSTACSSIAEKRCPFPWSSSWNRLAVNLAPAVGGWQIYHGYTIGRSPQGPAHLEA